jgi:cation diffusion facilitator family transporter
MPTRSGIRSVQVGILWNVVLAMIKLLAGIVGNTYALVADAIESTADVFTSLVVWRGLRVASREPDEEYPFGYGKAEPLAASVVSLVLLGAAIGIAIEAVREIRTPHMTPAPWTLGVLVAVVAVKWTLSRRVRSVGVDLGSTALHAEGWHHLSDAVTSMAAFVGISIAILGSRYWDAPYWASADDWAALLACFVIAANGASILRAASAELMDRAPAREVVDRIRNAAESVPDVLATEKLAVRKAAGDLSLDDAHVVSGMVKGAIRKAEPRVTYVLVHMEPYEANGQSGSVEGMDPATESGDPFFEPDGAAS